MPISEAARVKVVKSLGIIGSEPEHEFDRLARLVGHVANASYAHVCFIDDAHQFIKASEGASLPRLMPRDESLCTASVLSGAPTFSDDLQNAPHRSIRELYEDHGFRSYASVPIRLPSLHVVGAVAVLSRDRLSLSERQMAALEECAELAGRETLIKKPGAQSKSMSGMTGEDGRVPDAIRAVMMTHMKVLRAVSDGVIVLRTDGTINFVNTAAELLLGRVVGSLLNANFHEEVGDPDKAAEAENSTSPVSASLSDGAERLVRSALFRHAQRGSLRVGYAVSPIIADSRPIGAVVVFRALEDAELSNGMDLRNTLREVAKLKDQLAKMENAHRSMLAAASRPLPSLASRSRVEFSYLMDTIKEERAAQVLREQALLGDAELRRSAVTIHSPGSRLTESKSLPVARKTMSRSERWLASDLP